MSTMPIQLRLALRCVRRSRPRTRRGRSSISCALRCRRAPSANAGWIASTARCWPVGSKPAARVCTASSASRAGAVEPHAMQALRRVRRLPGFGEHRAFPASDRSAAAARPAPAAGEPRSCTRASSSSREEGRVERAAYRASATAGSDTGAGVRETRRGRLSPLATSAKRASRDERRAQCTRLRGQRFRIARRTARPAAGASPGLRRVRRSAASAPALRALGMNLRRSPLSSQALRDRPARDQQHGQPQQRQRDAARRGRSIAASASLRAAQRGQRARRRSMPCGRARGAGEQRALQVALRRARVSMQRSSAPRPCRVMSRTLAASARSLRRSAQRPALARAARRRCGNAVRAARGRRPAARRSSPAGPASSGARDSENAARLAGARDGRFAARGSWWSPRTARALRAPACRRVGRWYSPSIRSGAFSSAEPRSSTKSVRIGAGRASFARIQPASTVRRRRGGVRRRGRRSRRRTSPPAARDSDASVRRCGRACDVVIGGLRWALARNRRS